MSRNWIPKPMPDSVQSLTPDNLQSDTYSARLILEPASLRYI